MIAPVALSRMDLTNESYLIIISTRNSSERCYRDGRSWVEESSRARKLPATAEQVLNP